jgi:hypothetical protein
MTKTFETIAFSSYLFTVIKEINPIVLVSHSKGIIRIRRLCEKNQKKIFEAATEEVLRECGKPLNKVKKTACVIHC